MDQSKPTGLPAEAFFPLLADYTAAAARDTKEMVYRYRRVVLRSLVLLFLCVVCEVSGFIFLRVPLPFMSLTCTIVVIVAAPVLGLYQAYRVIYWARRMVWAVNQTRLLRDALRGCRQHARGFKTWRAQRLVGV